MPNVTQPRKSDVEILALKESWKRDGCWDIEDSEGFEAHRDELIAWRREYERSCEEAFRHQLEQLAERERISVEQARDLHFAERGAERATGQAVRALRHLFNNAGLHYEDLDADLRDFVGEVVNAAAQTAEIERIRAGAAK